MQDVGPGVTGFAPGLRVGIPWVHWTCGVCPDCTRGRENLCPNALFTGYDVDGGYAEYALADARFCFRVPESYSSREAAPLLCAGLIGYRSYRMAGPVERLGIYGFGAAAHLLAQVAKSDGVEVFAFTRSGDREAQDFARSVGVAWAGDSELPPPTLLDAAILFAPVGSLVPQALRAVRPGGTVVCGGIHMSDIPSFPYALLWRERVLRSVANLTNSSPSDDRAVSARRSECSVDPLAHRCAQGSGGAPPTPLSRHPAYVAAACRPGPEKPGSSCDTQSASTSFGIAPLRRPTGRPPLKTMKVGIPWMP